MQSPLPITQHCAALPHSPSLPLQSSQNTQLVTAFKPAQSRNSTLTFDYRSSARFPLNELLLLGQRQGAISSQGLCFSLQSTASLHWGLELIPFTFCPQESTCKDRKRYCHTETGKRRLSLLSSTESLPVRAGNDRSLLGAACIQVSSVCSVSRGRGRKGCGGSLPLVPSLLEFPGGK